MKKLNLIFLFGIVISIYSHANIILKSNTDLKVSIDPSEEQVVLTAFDIFSKDYNSVFGGNVVKNANAQVVISTIGVNSDIEKAIAKETLDHLCKHKEGFLLLVKDSKLYVLGSDKRGTAYGILELSRLIGVSPWEWWADSHIDKKDTFTLEEGYTRMEYPSVAHRGIFLNDEDWGLMPWSSLTYEPSDIKGQIGPKTHARIFELLLRLRANTFWPAMHSCSVAFYFTPGNKEMADKYGIFVGTSHCEPMVRNTNAEWATAGTGEFDYVNNRDNVLKFWEDRVKELSGSDNIYTLGIRGVHDSRMLGAKTLQEQKDALKDVLEDQRKMIAENLNPNVEEVSQVFIPYKEVLDVYNLGLEVPEDVALMWCDDNYGYIRHFPNEKERARKGGNGIYYHISYWGRPHDYLWLSTNHPAQLYTQMKLAYDKGAKDQWILNVGDIKPAEYLIELFMDMAWDIDGIENNIEGLDDHLYKWLSREFGDENANDLLYVMNEYYRLAYIRKPEFMGSTRTEERDPKFSIVSDLPWSEKEIVQRISEYQGISDKVVDISKNISSEKHDAWFQLVEYPVRSATEMNKKHLYAHLARHNKMDWKYSDDAFDLIEALTNKYNTLGNGKWNRMMDFQPRRLPVFERVAHVEAETPLMEHKEPLFLFDGNDYSSFDNGSPVAHGLGYNRGAISLPEGTSVTYNFVHDKNDSIQVEVALAPNHPVNDNKLRYSISIDNELAQIVDFKTQGRSEEWKENVLRNQAIRISNHSLNDSKEHILTIKALDEGVVVDQIKIW